MGLPPLTLTYSAIYSHHVDACIYYHNDLIVARVSVLSSSCPYVYSVQGRTTAAITDAWP